MHTRTEGLVEEIHRDSRQGLKQTSRRFHDDLSRQSLMKISR